MVPKFQPFNKAIANVIISACRVSTSKQFDYGNKYNREAMNKTSILLPAKNKKIDFDFINRFIAELEAERLAELEAYLLATGLIDATLTHEEEKVLEEFKQGKVAFGEFKVT